MNFANYAFARPPGDTSQACASATAAADTPAARKSSNNLKNKKPHPRAHYAFCVIVLRNRNAQSINQYCQKLRVYT